MVYLASYKGTKPGWQGWFERLTRWVTRSAYAHSVIVINYQAGSPGYGASATGAAGVHGAWGHYDTADWDLLPLRHIDDTQVINFLVDHDGEPYDAIGCIRSVLPFVSREHPTRWFCSEVCATIIGLHEPWRYTPGLLHAVVASAQALGPQTLDEVAHG